MPHGFPFFRSDFRLKAGDRRYPFALMACRFFHVFSDPTAENRFGRTRASLVVRQRLVVATASAPVRVWTEPVADAAHPTARDGLSTRSVYGRKQPYSYTERKRICKEHFGKRESVLNVPYLTMQKAQLCRLPAEGRAPAKAQTRRFGKVLCPRSRIVSHNGFVEMKFIEFNIAKPPF